jgi:hypothetical protein
MYRIILTTLIGFASFIHARAQDEKQVIDPGGDCIDKFFSRTRKLPAPEKVMLIQKNGKTIGLQDFLKSQSVSELGIEARYGLLDLDRDGRKEMIIYDYTGGAHCCDEIYVFANSSLNQYRYMAKMFAGDVCINDSNQFVYSFHQEFGYFFTCFACYYEDSTDAGPIPMDHITLRYSKGKLLVVPPDKELRSKINDNLGKLGEEPYVKLADEADQDNGLRKAFAMNLAVAYFSFGKNLPATKALFNKYYKHPDAGKVWTAFVKQLQRLAMDNSF